MTGDHTPRHRKEAHVRSLSVHPDVPERVIAGVEVGGVFVSDDYGESWEERRAGLQTEREDDLQYDVHHVPALSGDELVVSCGGGLYRTRNVGDTWTRLDDHNHSHFREAFSHGGRLYAAATRGPWTSEMDATLFESTDRAILLNPYRIWVLVKSSFSRGQYPTEPMEVCSQERTPVQCSDELTPSGRPLGTSQCDVSR